MTSHEHIEEIEAIVRRYPPSGNESALQSIRSHLFALRCESSDGNVGGKLSAIESSAGIYFSDRKHQKYPGGGEEVRSWILADCSQLKALLDD